MWGQTRAALNKEGRLAGFKEQLIPVRYRMGVADGPEQKGLRFGDAQKSSVPVLCRFQGCGMEVLAEVRCSRKRCPTVSFGSGCLSSSHANLRLGSGDR